MKFRSPYDVVYHPFVTEKTLFQMERENKLEFVVNRRANKTAIKEAVEKMFECTVVDVNTKTRKDGKHAIIKFHKGTSAEEIGMRIGIF